MRKELEKEMEMENEKEKEKLKEQEKNQEKSSGVWDTYLRLKKVREEKGRMTKEDEMKKGLEQMEREEDIVKEKAKHRVRKARSEKRWARAEELGRSCRALLAPGRLKRKYIAMRLGYGVLTVSNGNSGKAGSVYSQDMQKDVFVFGTGDKIGDDSGTECEVVFEGYTVQQVREAHSPPRACEWVGN